MGRLDGVGAALAAGRLPHLRVMGVWRERPLDVVLRGDTRLPVGGGGPWGTVALLGAGVNPPAPSSDY